MTASPPAKPPNRLAIAAVSLWTGLIVLVSHWMAQQSQRWLPVQASSAAPLVDGLFGFETGLGTFIFLGVLTLMAWSLLFHRARKYDESDAEPIEGNTRLEIIWTVIPLVLVLLIAANAIRVNRVLGVLGPMEHVHGGTQGAAAATSTAAPGADSSGLATSAAAASGLQVEVIARQWSWEFRYPLADGDYPGGPGAPHGAEAGRLEAGGLEAGGLTAEHGRLTTVSSTELHLPVNRPVTFRLLSEDVLHGFYVPAFRLKQDVVPGQAISFRLTPTRLGRYRLRDSQFSGTWFAANQADVVVESPAAFAHWLELGVQQPLQPGLSPAAADYARRQQRSSNGWATVVPAPPPLVNVPGSASLPHDA